LDVGQKIYFKHNGKKELLLEVSEDLQGEKLNVRALIKERGKVLEKEKETKKKKDKH
jgi:hypothetical protein